MAEDKDMKEGQDHGRDAKAVDAEQATAIFGFFNEIGIIHQLSSALFKSRLPDGVTLAQFSVLNHLIRVQDGRTPLELASAFQVPKTSMTHSLAGLEARGLIEMRPNEQDRRSKTIWLTPEGRTFRDNAIQLLSTDMARLAPQLDLGAMQEAIPTLAMVRKVLDKDRE